MTTTAADTASGIEQQTHYQGLEDTPDVDIEFGGMGAVAVGKSFWAKLKGVFGAAAKGAASSSAVKDALNSYSPGLGDAAQAGMQLVEAGNAGDPQALAQLKAVADVAASGDPGAAKTNDMLKAIADARKAAAVEVGKTYVVRDPKTGKKKKFKSKAAAQAWMKQQQQSQGQQQRRPGQQPMQQRPQQRPGMPQARPGMPTQPRPQPYGVQPRPQPMQQPQPYGVQPYPYGGAAVDPYTGMPYGMQPGMPYGYGVPQPYQQPYGPAYYDEGYMEQVEYYGDADESFPDEGIQGENTIAYQG